MRKKLWMALVLVLCVFSFHSVPTSAAEDIITNDESGIPDPGLYRNILQVLKKGTGETFTRQEAESVTMLWITDWSQGKGDAKNYRVKSFRGLGLLKNLKEFTAYKQRLTTGQLEEIAKEVPQLEALSLNANEIDSLKSLKDMRNMKILNIADNHLTSLEGIEDMKNLTDLEAYNNQLTDVNPLKNLTNLSSLELSGNRLTNVSGLKNLTRLAWLLIENNEIKKLPNLKNLKRLYITDFTCNQLSEKELKNKLPKHLFKNKSWAGQQIMMQKSNFKITVTSPKRLTKISGKTTEITGTVKTKAKRGTFSVYMKILDSSKPKYFRAEIDKSNHFSFQGLNLKKYKGCRAQLCVYYSGADPEDGATVNRVAFTIK